MTSRPGEPPLLKDRNLHVVFSVTLMAVMGVASLSPAFPRIADEFHLDAAHVGWLITIFTMPGIVLAPVVGVLADRHGRRRLLVPSLLLFGAAGVACGFARRFDLLLAFRFLQGVGASGIASLNVTIISDLYTGHRRGTAMGYNASILSLGTAAYPLIGGFLAAIAWNDPFFLPLLAFPVALAVMLFLKNPEPTNEETMGRYLRSVARSLDFRAIVLYLAGIATFLILYGSYLTWYPFLIDRRFGGSAIAIGLVMSAASIATAITSAMLGRLMRIVSGQSLLRTSYVLYAVSLLMVPFVPSLPVLLVPAILFGAANGINIPTIQTVLAGLAPPEYRAAFLSLNGMVLRVGQTLGPLVAGLFVTWGGMNAAFTGGAAIAVLMLLVLVAAARRMGPAPSTVPAGRPGR